ncbi:KptA family-domain-containing protein [Pyronema domesticum]|nr:KptA family-domain-containing protein [Pyronema domesticum]
MSADVKISKALSSTLRHNAAKEGLTLREDGYARVDDLLAMNKYKSHKLTFPQLKEIVDSNDKQRYSMTEEAGVWYIRANQGHSISVAVEMEPLPHPGEIVHGTYYAFLEPIITSGGLKRGTRVHIHLAPAAKVLGAKGDEAETHEVAEEGVQGKGAHQDDTVISGMRKDAEIVFIIDGDAAAASGMRFFKSANGVILTEGNEEGVLPMGFVKRVEDRKRGLGTVWQHGVGMKVEIREEWKKVPLGKGGRGGGRGGRGGRGQGRGARGRGDRGGERTEGVVEVGEV